MIKKQKKTKIAIIIILVSVISLPLVIIGAFCVTFFACDWLLSSKETFHKPSLIHSNSRVLFESNDGNVYSFMTSNIYKCTIGQKPKLFFPKNINTVQVNDACSNDNYLFATTSKAGTILNCQILVFDKNMDIVNKIDSEQYIYSINVDGDNLYCIFDCRKEKTDDICFGLKRISILTFNESIIYENILNDTVYYDDDSMLLFQSNKPTSTTKYLYKNTDQLFFYSDPSFSCLSSMYGVINVNSEDNVLSLRYNEKEYRFNLPYSNSNLLNKVYLSNNILVLAIKEFIDNKECVPLHSSCICHCGRVSIMSYDLTSHSFVETTEYPSGTAMIYYDTAGAAYYYNGGLYYNGNLSRQCSEIKTDDKIVVKDKDYHSAKTNLWDIEYYKGEFYGI